VIRRVLHIILAGWFLIISVGLVINKHFSATGLYDISIYTDAASCCENPAECTSCHPDSEPDPVPLCCASHETESDPFDNPLISAQTCCFDISEVFSLPENLYPRTSQFSVPPASTLLLAHLSLFSFEIWDSTSDPEASTSPDPPPGENDQNIYLQISVFRC
jgi:hypothetical protein